MNIYKGFLVGTSGLVTRILRYAGSLLQKHPELQDPRMFHIEKGLWRSSSPAWFSDYARASSYEN